MFPYSKKNTVYNYLEASQEEILKKPRSSASFSTSSSQSPPTMAPSSLFPGPYGSHPQSLPPPTAAPVQDINQFGDYGSYCMLLPPPTPSSFNHQPYLTLAVSASNILLSSPHHSLFSRFAIRSGFLNLIFFFNLHNRAVAVERPAFCLCPHNKIEALHQAILSSNLPSLQSSL